MRTQPPPTHNESERLDHLRLLDILDSGPEPIFDALTRTASLICNVPIALLSLIDADRQWFKASVGIDGLSEVPRDISFCAHTILQDHLLEVPDTMRDTRFHDLPAVVNEPRIRFYAGVPVALVDGINVGTLCVLDHAPKALTPMQQEALANLALVASRALEMRKKALDLDRFNTTLLDKARVLNAREVLYQSIVEDQIDMISLARPDGVLTFVNEAYASHFGLRPDQMVGSNLLDYTAEDDRDAVAAHLRELCRSPGTAHGENRMRSAGGAMRWVAWSNRAIGDDEGQVIGLHSVGRDVTDRKVMEMELRDSHERYRSLYESTPAMMHSIDLQGRLLGVSDKWLHTLGYERAEVLGRPSTDFFTQASRDYGRETILPEFFRKGRCENIPYQMVCKDGRVIDVLLSAVLKEATPDREAHSLAVLEDVTEKLAIAKALRAQEERLQLATTANQIGIWEVDIASGRLEWNDTMFSIFGGSRSTFSSQLADWSDKLHPEDRQRSQQAFESAIQYHTPLDLDFRVVREGGNIRHVNARGVVILDADGKAVRVLGTNFDITERKAAEQALAYSEQRLRTIANNLPVLIAHIDRNYRYTFANDNHQRWFNLDSPIVGKTILEAFGQRAFEQVQPQLAAAMNGASVTFEVVSDTQQPPRQLSVHYVPDRDPQGRHRGVICMVEDRTEQHQARARLEDSERQLRAVADGLPVLMSYVDPQERIQFMNATSKAWLGVDPDWARGRPMREVIGDALFAQRSSYLRQALTGKRVDFPVESDIGGSLRFLQASYLPDIRSDGKVVGVFTLSTDVTALKLAELELQRLVLIDSLTGLPNRRYFNQRLEKAIARSRRTGQTMALMFLDVDSFKSINDTLGHGIGDEVLMEFSHRINSAIRKNDFAARLAGDEFVIILEDLKSGAEAQVVGNKLLEAIRLPMALGGTRLWVTTSMGITINTAEAISADQLINRADKALYEAKAAGRDGLHLHNPSAV